MRDYSNYHQSRKEIITSHGQQVFNKSLDSFESYDIEVNGIPNRAIIRDRYSERENVMSIRSNKGVIKAGDIVNHNGKYWLLRKYSDSNPVFDMAEMVECPSTLKWLNSIGLIRETPFAFKSSPAIYPFESDKIMVLSKERRTILIQANDDTKLIDKEKRFIFDNRAWSVIGINGLLDGIIELTLEEEQINTSTDNLQLRICDYFGNVANYKISVSNGNSLNLSIGDSVTLIAHLFNNENVVNNPAFSYESSDETILTVDQTGVTVGISEGVATVTVGYEDISETVEIRVTEQTVNNFSAEITGSVEIKKSLTQKYTVQFFINGKEVSEQAVFTLTADDGVTATQLASIESIEGNSVVIKGNQLGYIQLHATSQNGLIKGTKAIRIKSLI